MKKLILMLLLVVGGVMSANAADVTRRIYVIAAQHFMQNRDKASLHLHAWYTDNSGEVASYDMATFANTASYSQYPPCVWFADVTFDENKTIGFEVYASNNSNWKSNNQIEFTSTTDNYYYWNSQGNGNIDVQGTLAYYAYVYDGNSWSTTQLTTTDRISYTCMIDNMTNYHSDMQVLIAPSFALYDTQLNQGWISTQIPSYKWEMILRPSGDNGGSKTIHSGFANVENLCGGYNNSTDYLNPSANCNYTLTYRPYAWNFSLNPFIPCSVSSVGYSTFSSIYDVTIPSGVTASYITGVNGNNLTSEAYNGTIKARDAALLQASAGTYQFTPATSASAVSGNMLVAVDTRIENLQATTDDYTNYILTNQTVDGEKAVGFYKANNSKVAAGKAYLQLPTTSTAREFFSLWDQETTSINSVESIQNGNVIFNLNGQRVNNATKGLYIVNGKKVMFK